MEITEGCKNGPDFEIELRRSVSIDVTNEQTCALPCVLTPTLSDSLLPMEVEGKNPRNE